MSKGWQTVYMLDHIHCPQKGMAQASEWGGLLRTGHLPYLLLRRLVYFPFQSFAQSP
jgi:hypothetical protein